MSRTPAEVELQRRYYAETAEHYDRMHVDESDEHFFALSFLVGMLDYLEIGSILDVGSGTGRALLYTRQRKPGIRLVGVEPVAELRRVARENGLAEDELVDGDATRLAFADGEFDLVCEFGMLHHVRDPAAVVAEMLRVAKKAIFVSDSNNFGQGSPLGRLIKQTIDLFGLWKVADYVKTRGKGYTITEGDGLAYSYSVFNNYGQIERACRSVHLLNTQGGRINFYRTAGHVALLGLKE